MSELSPELAGKACAELADRLAEVLVVGHWAVGEEGVEGERFKALCKSERAGLNAAVDTAMEPFKGADAVNPTLIVVVTTQALLRHASQRMDRFVAMLAEEESE